MKKLTSIVSVAVVIVSLSFYIVYSSGVPPFESRTVGNQTIASQTTTQNQTSFAAPPTLLTVMIEGTEGGAYFTPPNVTLSVGAKVTWVNMDTDQHTVTSYNATATGKALFDSGILDQRQTFTYVFTSPGVYRYFCAVHPWMQGAIIIQSQAG